MATIFDRIANLTRLERRRVDTTLTRIHKQPWLMFVFNAFLLSLNAMARLHATLLGTKERLFGKTGRQGEGTPVVGATRRLPHTLDVDALRVLLVVEESVQQCFTYRVAQKLEQLKIAGYQLVDSENVSGKVVRWIPWREQSKIREIVHFYDVIVFYRVPGFPDILNLLEYIRSTHRILLYDIDDLIFDEGALRDKFKQSTGQLPKHELNAMLYGAQLYRSAMQRCDYGIASTKALAMQIEKIGSINKCFVLPNGLDQAVIRKDAWGKPPKNDEYLYIFYGSGTRTHDEDFDLVAPALEHVLTNYSQVRMLIVGYLTLPERLKKYQDRIVRLPIMDFGSYLEALSGAHISIAPLEPGIFADCKSEIKWIEAGALGVCSVVSRTHTYSAAIDNGKDGYVAEDTAQWQEYLSHLLNDHDVRVEIAANARSKIMRQYSMTKLSRELDGIIDSVVKESMDKGLVQNRTTNKRKIVFVNTVYPPHESGGATVVLCNIIRQLRERYGAEYEIQVFTCDVKDPFPYQITEYEHEGILVASLSMPTSPDADWKYHDDQVERIFASYLHKVQPDIVHFHSVQRLTASVVDVTRKANIPYLVTVHDAWWISDYQFLVDDSGNVIDELQTDPIVIAQTSKDPISTFERLSFLRSQLRSAKSVLAVSKYQSELYKRNGISNVVLNINGVDPLPGAPAVEKDVKSSTHDRKLRLGYLGGISAHKGYHLLKEAIAGGEFSNLELVVVDFETESDYEEHWGSIAVRFVPQITWQSIPEFYKNIDVLLAPSIWPESFGLVTREAALAGKWIVCSDSGGLPEAVADSKNGWIFPAGNRAALTALLERLDSDPDKYKQAPDVDITSLGIRSVAEQVDELAVLYKQILSFGNEHAKAEETISAA